MFRTDLLSIIRSLNTVFTANVICQIRESPTSKTNISILEHKRKTV